MPQVVLYPCHKLRDEAWRGDSGAKWEGAPGVEVVSRRMTEDYDHRIWLPCALRAPKSSGALSGAANRRGGHNL
jgi:hypothetical protein